MITKKFIDTELSRLVADTKSFINTLISINFTPSKIKELSSIQQDLEKLYLNVVDQNISDKNTQHNYKKIQELLSKQHKILVNLHFTEIALIHEKADVQVATSFLIQDINDFLHRQTQKN